MNQPPFDYPSEVLPAVAKMEQSAITIPMAGAQFLPNDRSAHEISLEEIERIRL